MRKIVAAALLLPLGLATGGAAAFGTGLLLGDHRTAASEATVFVPTGQILAPLVFGDGRLAGYVAFEAQLEVPASQGNAIKERLPVLLNAINMRTYRTPMASGPDGLLPSIQAFRRVLLESAAETYGRPNIRRVAVTQATPA